MGPMSIRWVAVHEEYDPPHLFADRQESGPFKSWYHRHCFLDDGEGGTLLRDEVTYTLPGGWLGRWLGRTIVEPKLKKMFTYRHEVTRRSLESPPSTTASGVDDPTATIATTEHDNDGETLCR
jgi:ligand-binding SRPBCC domain-containing protein